VPVVFDSPHSGFTWPPGWHPAAPRAAVLTSCDALVDALLADAPAAGIAVLTATLPRAYVDINRAEDDLDPAVLEAPWPAPLSPTDYSRRGMGLIRRLALPDIPMYSAPLPVAEVRARIEGIWRPYRAALAARLDALHVAHGRVVYVDWHSMKSRGNAMNVDAGAARPDVVVSDRHGTTADPSLTTWIADWWAGRGHTVRRNDPYQGGDLVRTFGAPGVGRHAVQVELNRRLYLDESTATRAAGFDALAADCSAFARALAEHVADGRP
jgi:N-formylglutamate deformylase